MNIRSSQKISFSWSNLRVLNKIISTIHVSSIELIYAVADVAVGWGLVRVAATNWPQKSGQAFVLGRIKSGYHYS